MRLAKLFITLALALCGWHGALASALCARHADCHASAAARGRHAPRGRLRTAGREAGSRGAAHAAGHHGQGATGAAAAPANDHGHCGLSGESPRANVHAAPHGAEAETARDGDENVSSESVADLRAPASSCGHCVGRETRQPAGLNSVARDDGRDAHAAHAPTRQPVTLPRSAPRPRFAPTGHAPPRGRPLHLLNSALLI
jgi:hypothetical protein